MQRSLFGALALGAAALPCTAAAQAQLEFHVGNVGIEVIPPAGYCLPSGAGVGIAQVVAAADDGNVTDLTLFPCTDQSGDAPDYYLVKTPKSVLLTGISRAELLASLRAEYDKPGFAEAMKAQDPAGKATDSYTKLLGAKTEIVGSVTPLGLDETCAYMGGVLKLDSAAVSYKRAVSACITAVGDRVVMIYRYSPGEPGNVLVMMKSVKALALAMKAKPAK